MKFGLIFFISIFASSMVTAFVYNNQGYGSGCYGQDCNSTSLVNTSDANNSFSQDSSGGGSSRRSSSGSSDQWITYEFLDEEFKAKESILQELGVRERVALLYEGTIYFFGIASHSQGQYKVISSPKDQIFSLRGGEERRIDIDQDGFDDMTLLLTPVSLNFVNASFSPLRPKIPGQLLDITFKVRESSISSSDELGAITTFQSFGRNPVNLTLTYTLYDLSNHTFYSEQKGLTVFSEEVLIDTFEGLNLPEGPYSLELEVTYIGITERFESRFNIQAIKLSPVSNYVLIMGIISLVCLILLFLILRIKRKTNFP